MIDMKRLQLGQLSVGNWISMGGVERPIPHQLTAFDLMSLDFSKIQPVQLTEEILKDAGFKKDEREDWDGEPFYVWYKNGIDIHVDLYSEPISFMYAVYVKGVARSFKGGIPVYWVHHLQNLFASLTYDFLEIKL